MKLDPMQAADFYKFGHVAQYAPKMRYLYSNFTPRSNKLAPKGVSGQQIDHVINYGIQGFTKWFLIDLFNKEFFQVPKAEAVARYKRRTDTSLGPDSVDTAHIEALHDLGYLPIEIKALPEGSRSPMKVPVFTVQNTIKDERYAWIVNYLETAFSDSIWKPTTVATIAFEYRRILHDFAVKTGSPIDFVMWQGHDFSMRGNGGIYDSAAADSGHLLSFLGTDTVPAIGYLEDYYNAMNDFVGGSVPASEHSVACVNIAVIEKSLRDTGQYNGITIADLT